jgi:hypothetical protein
MALQWVVPADVLTASKGSVGAMVELITLFLALFPGLLVFTAFSVYSPSTPKRSRSAPTVAVTPKRAAAGGAAATLPELSQGSKPGPASETPSQSL